MSLIHIINEAQFVKSIESVQKTYAIKDPK